MRISANARPLNGAPVGKKDTRVTIDGITYASAHDAREVLALAACHSILCKSDPYVPFARSAASGFRPISEQSDGRTAVYVWMLTPAKASESIVNGKPNGFGYVFIRSEKAAVLLGAR